MHGNSFSRQGWAYTRWMLPPQLIPAWASPELIQMPNSAGHSTELLPSGYVFNIAMEAMAHRNRWFTELKNGWIFPWRTVSHNQCVHDRRVQHPDIIRHPEYLEKEGKQKCGERGCVCFFFVSFLKEKHVDISMIFNDGYDMPLKYPFIRYFY